MSQARTLRHRPGFRFAFDPDSCSDCPGNCCRGIPGYVWVSAGEIRNLAALLKMNIIDFKQQYIRKIDNRLSLKERRLGDDYPCIFFDIGSRRCSVYEARPEQCRSYPFWEENRHLTGDLTHDCPGIRGDYKPSEDECRNDS
ncbi:MAG: YkgJ family cysteine cluster protein [FCB group bacterium]|nr:YkgJ family cysteine cluster protein [FCB group bacterium]